MNTPLPPVIKTPAKVLGCLRPGYLTVFLGYGVGMMDGGIPTDIPIDLVPSDLRMPNSEFIVVLDRVNSQITGVERRDHDAENQCDSKAGN